MIRDISTEHVANMLQIAFGSWVHLFDDIREAERGGPEERIDFVCEWPTMGIALDTLAEQRAAGRMSPEQERKHDELLALVAERRPVVQRWLDALTSDYTIDQALADVQLVA